MGEIGKYNKLKVIRESEVGVYLDGGDYGELFLPTDLGLVDYKVGETLEVFLYSDSQEKAIATTKKPYATVGKFSCLKVIDVLDIGAFLDWGLPKDLFAPLREQKEVMEKGESYIVYVYKDDVKDRVAASSRLDAFLDREPAAFQENDKVDLLIAHQTDLGYNAIINDLHWGLLYQDEVFQDLEYGQKVEGFIKKVREDGKIDLSLQTQGYQKMDDLESAIIAQITKGGGMLDVTDKSSPETIYELFAVSKKKYKMALGSLYKAQRITIEDDVIKGL